MTYRLVNMFIIYAVSLPIESMASVQRSALSFLVLDRFASPFVHLEMNTLCPR